MDDLVNYFLKLGFSIHANKSFMYIDLGDDWFLCTDANFCMKLFRKTGNYYVTVTPKKIVGGIFIEDEYFIFPHEDGSCVLFERDVEPEDTITFFDIYTITSSGTIFMYSYNRNMGVVIMEKSLERFDLDSESFFNIVSEIIKLYASSNIKDEVYNITNFLRAIVADKRFKG